MATGVERLSAAGRAQETHRVVVMRGCGSVRARVLECSRSEIGADGPAHRDAGGCVGRCLKRHESDTDMFRQSTGAECFVCYYYY